MIDPVCFYATYGPGMGFELMLGSDGSFAYTLAGNMGTMFLLRQLGYWQGNDPARVLKIRQQALSLVQTTPSNAPTMPDSAFIAISYEPELHQPESHLSESHQSELNIIAGEYALYEPPTTISPLLQDIIGLVHGDWITATHASLLADCQIIPGQSRLTAKVTLQARGKLPVQLANPLLPGVFSMMLIEQNGEDTLEPDSSELRLTAINDINPANTVIELAPGQGLTVNLELATDLPVGDWNLITTMELGPVPAASGKLATGMITWGPTRVVLPI